MHTHQGPAHPSDAPGALAEFAAAPEEWNPQAACRVHEAGAAAAVRWPPTARAAAPNILWRRLIMSSCRRP